MLLISSVLMHTANSVLFSFSGIWCAWLTDGRLFAGRWLANIMFGFSACLKLAPGVCILVMVNLFLPTSPVASWCFFQPGSGQLRVPGGFSLYMFIASQLTFVAGDWHSINCYITARHTAKFAGLSCLNSTINNWTNVLFFQWILCNFNHIQRLWASSSYHSQHKIFMFYKVSTTNTE